MPESRLFRASDDYHLHYRHWPAEGETLRGYIVALHGIQSHSGWYEATSAQIARSGFDVRFLDRRGSGRNGCRRGDAPDYVRLVQDVRQFLDEIRWERDRHSPDAPVVLTAVSWGGKVAAATAALFPDRLDGLALQYPGLCARIRPTAWQRCLIRLARASGKGQKRIPIPLDDPALFTSDPAWQEFIRRDSATLRHVSLDFLQASLDLERLIDQRAATIVAPTLLMLAGGDEIIDNLATRALVSRFGARQQIVLEYPLARHTLEFEPNRAEIADDLISWLKRLPASFSRR